MKFNFTSAKMNLSVTTDSGEPIYSYDAENVSVKLDLYALIESAATIGGVVAQAVNGGGDLSNIETLIANMQQQAETEKTDAA